MWSRWCKNLAQRNAVAVGRRVPKFGVDGNGGGAGPVVSERLGGAGSRQQKAGDGKVGSQQQQQQQQKPKKQGFVEVVETREQQPVIMAAAAKVAKRVPLIKFPNRKAGETKTAVAVNRASGGGAPAPAPAPALTSLPSGTASSQPPRTILSEAEIESILLGGAAP